jgi:hypothetical protein
MARSRLVPSSDASSNGARVAALPLRPVRVGENRWVAVVKVEDPSAAYVSLRAEALDTKGNKVEQTITRAYALK